MTLFLAVAPASSLARATTPITPRSADAGQPVNQVVTWNRVLLSILRTPGAQPANLHPTRSMAILHAAIYNAVDAIERSHALYEARFGHPHHASQSSAAAAAAHTVLISLYPTLRTSLESDYAQALAQIPASPRKHEGILIGDASAKRILASRAHDGSTITAPQYIPKTGPGAYQLTSPKFAAPVFTSWSQVTPFALRSADQFRPPPPPPLTSDAYATALHEVQSLGLLNSTARSPDQTQVGKFWAAPIQNYWNEIAQTQALAHHTTLAQTARLFALLDIAYADGVIAFYDAKYAYSFWRPITAIRAAEADGNPNTAGDPNWTPLATTPPDPSYPGAHSVLSAAGASVLTAFFGNRNRFSVASEVLPGVQRSFTSFSAAVSEAGRSRIYAGIHTSLDDGAGQALGRNVARYVLSKVLLPAHRARRHAR